MTTNYPPIADVRSQLQALGHAEIQELSRRSLVPLTTLWKIKDGTTKNPGIETVRAFYPHLKEVVVVHRADGYVGPCTRVNTKLGA